MLLTDLLCLSYLSHTAQTHPPYHLDFGNNPCPIYSIQQLSGPVLGPEETQHK